MIPNQIGSLRCLSSLPRDLDEREYAHYTYNVYTEADMVKYLTQHGNSAALVIDKPIMELLHIDMKTPLEISTDGKNLVISPVADAGREKRFRNSLARVSAKYSKTFAKLAK